MGTIRKQSILSSLFIYVGFAIGAVNVLILFPKYLTPEQFGLTRLLLDVSLLLSTVSTMASVPMVLKFYPFYNSYLPKEKNDLPFLSVMLCIIGCFLVLTFITLNKDFIVRKFGQRSPLFVTHFYLLYPLTVSLTFFSLFESYAWSLKKPVLSNLLREVVYRLVVLLLLVFFIYQLFSIETFFSLYSLVYFPSTLILLVVLIKSGQFPFHISISVVTKRLYKKMLAFGLFIFSGTVLNVLARTVDVIIISSQSAGGLKDAGIFVIATYLISLMEVPQRGIVSIATPIISQSWKDRNLAQIDSIYQKTSLNLLIIGLVIGGVLFLNTQNMIRFLGNDYAPIKEIIIIMGIAKLIDLGTGLNSQILLLSKYWKIDFITNMLFVFLSIPLNYFLIKNYGVIGSAFANLIALCVFNGIRFFYIWRLFHLQPFSQQTAQALFLAAFVIVIVSFIPSVQFLYVDIAIKTLIYITLFVGGVILFGISKDVQALFHSLWDKLRAL
jgi:O-antigen/teichoic acid export membrane protein